MVDDHVLDETGAFLLEGLNHLFQFLLAAEAGIVLQPIDGHVAHVLISNVARRIPLVGLCLPGIGHPDEFEIL